MVCSRHPVAPACTWGNIGEVKCVPLLWKGKLGVFEGAHGTEPVGLLGGEVGHDKHTFKKKKKKKKKIDAPSF